MPSVVWKFVSVLPDDKSKVECQIKTHESCKKTISRGKDERNYTTSNILLHLRTYHSKLYEEAKKKQDEEKKEKQINTYFENANKKQKRNHVSPSTIPIYTFSSPELPSTSFSEGANFYKQQTLAECYQKYWDENDIRSKDLSYKIGEMMALDNQPYSMVENLGFVRLMEAAKPRYKMPGRKIFSEKIVPTIYEKALKCIKEMTSEVHFMSLTTDFWSATASGNQFLSLTGHCVFENFDQQAVVLHAKPFKDKHTGENINETIGNMIDQYNIPHHTIHSIVHDNASNMVKGIEDSNYDSLPCFIHTMQLALHECIFKQRAVRDIIAKCKNLHTHFSKSYVASNRLHDLQRSSKHAVLKVLNDCPTRWDSTFQMIERAVDIKEDIIEYSEVYKCNVEFHTNDWILMEKISELLGLFYSITKQMSHRYANSGDIIPHIQVLRRYVTDEVTKVRLCGLNTTLASLCDSFEGRFSSYEDNINCVYASYLNPCYKYSIFIDEKNDSVRSPENIELSLIEKFVEMEKEQAEREQIKNSSEEQNEKNNTDVQTEDSDAENDFDGFTHKNVNLLAKYHSQIRKERLSQPEESAEIDTPSLSRLNISRELTNFNKEPLLKLTDNPFDWWKKNRKLFPHLSKMARKYLLCPPSSVESERLFSIGGNIMTDHRNRLGADNCEMLMFLNYNLKLLPELEYKS